MLCDILTADAIKSVVNNMKSDKSPAWTGCLHFFLKNVLAHCNS